MEIVLPIAEVSVNILAILGLGGITGILAGMFGIGGGFLMTPLLIFIGIPPAVAVASSANQIVASSVSGFLTHWRKQNVDIKMGIFLLSGGLVGSSLGVALFTWLRSLGQIDLIISLCYIVFLGFISILMLNESIRTIFKIRKKKPSDEDDNASRKWMKKLPWQTHFPKSNIKISGWIPVSIGFSISLLVSIMGIGGGFFLIPAMIYLLRMPTSVVIGTSLFQVIFTTANVTFLHAVTTQTVDVVLAMLLLSSSVIGAQFGSKWSGKLPAEHLRGLLGLIVFTLACKLAFNLFATPTEIFTITSEVL